MPTTRVTRRERPDAEVLPMELPLDSNDRDAVDSLATMIRIQYQECVESTLPNSKLPLVNASWPALQDALGNRTKAGILAAVSGLTDHAKMWLQEAVRQDPRQGYIWKGRARGMEFKDVGYQARGIVQEIMEASQTRNGRE